MRGIKKFDSISSMSGILDITAHPKSWHLPEVFGPYEKKRETWEAHSAYQLAQKHKELLSNTRLLITVSEQDDAAFQDNEKFHDLLVGMGVAHDYRTSPGGHTWEYWLEQLPLHVAFHAGYPVEASGGPEEDAPADSPNGPTSRNVHKE